MHAAKTKAKRCEQLTHSILAAKVLSLGIWDARPGLRDQCWDNAPATRYDNNQN